MKNVKMLGKTRFFIIPAINRMLTLDSAVRLIECWV